MGRGRDDNCQNCIHADENRDGTYRCKLDRKDYEEDNWCKHHEAEGEND